MKQKRSYSLTASERKQKRHAAQIQTDKPVQVSSREAGEQAMIESQKQSAKSTRMIALIVCVALAILLAGFLVPVFVFLSNPYVGFDHVVARFRLDNGMVLEYIIEEEEYDIAATNFIFLAKNGYFDGTVIFDAGNPAKNTDGWVRFGGYEDQPNIWEGASSTYDSTHHRSQNEEFCRNFTALPNEKFKNVKNKFGYDLYSDKNGSARLGDIGVLAYIYNDTSTEFQMSYKSGASDQVESVSTTGVNMRDLKATMVGYAYNEQTVENLKIIASFAEPNVKTSTGIRWNPPQPDIRIDSVKVYNLDPKKWRSFDFIEYMNGSNDNGPRLRNWVGRA